MFQENFEFPDDLFQELEQIASPCPAAVKLDYCEAYKKVKEKNVEFRKMLSSFQRTTRELLGTYKAEQNKVTQLQGKLRESEDELNRMRIDYEELQNTSINKIHLQKQTIEELKRVEIEAHEDHIELGKEYLNLLSEITQYHNYLLNSKSHKMRVKTEKFLRKQDPSYRIPDIVKGCRRKRRDSSSDYDTDSRSSLSSFSLKSWNSQGKSKLIKTNLKEKFEGSWDSFSCESSQNFAGTFFAENLLEKPKNLKSPTSERGNLKSPVEMEVNEQIDIDYVVLEPEIPEVAPDLRGIEDIQGVSLENSWEIKKTQKLPSVQRKSMESPKILEIEHKKNQEIPQKIVLSCSKGTMTDPDPNTIPALPILLDDEKTEKTTKETSCQTFILSKEKSTNTENHKNFKDQGTETGDFLCHCNQKKPVMTSQGTSTCFSLVTRGTSTETLKTRSIGCNFPDYSEFDVDKILREMNFDVPRILKPLKELMLDSTSQTSEVQKVSTKVNTDIQNVRKRVDYMLNEDWMRIKDEKFLPTLDVIKFEKEREFAAIGHVMAEIFVDLMQQQNWIVDRSANEITERILEGLDKFRDRWVEKRVEIEFYPNENFEDSYSEAEMEDCLFKSPEVEKEPSLDDSGKESLETEKTVGLTDTIELLSPIKAPRIHLRSIESMSSPENDIPVRNLEENGTGGSEILDTEDPVIIGPVNRQKSCEDLLQDFLKPIAKEASLVNPTFEGNKDASPESFNKIPSKPQNTFIKPQIPPARNRGYSTDSECSFVQEKLREMRKCLNLVSPIKGSGSMEETPKKVEVKIGRFEVQKSGKNQEVKRNPEKTVKSKKVPRNPERSLEIQKKSSKVPLILEKQQSPKKVTNKRRLRKQELRRIANIRKFFGKPRCLSPIVDFLEDSGKMEEDKTLEVEKSSQILESSEGILEDPVNCLENQEKSSTVPEEIVLNEVPGTTEEPGTQIDPVPMEIEWNEETRSSDPKDLEKSSENSEIPGKNPPEIEKALEFSEIEEYLSPQSPNILENFDFYHEVPEIPLESRKTNEWPSDGEESDFYGFDEDDLKDCYYSRESPRSPVPSSFLEDSDGPKEIPLEPKRKQRGPGKTYIEKVLEFNQRSSQLVLKQENLEKLEEKRICRIRKHLKLYLSGPWSEEKFESCLETLKKFQSHPKLLVIGIWETVEDCKCEMSLDVTPPAPPLPKYQQKLILLLDELNRRNPDLPGMLLEHLESSLFRLDHTKFEVDYLENVTYFYTALMDLFFLGSLEMVHLFLYKSLYFLGYLAIPIAYVLLKAYPNLLPTKRELLASYRDDLDFASLENSEIPKISLELEKVDPLILTIISILTNTKCYKSKKQERFTMRSHQLYNYFPKRYVYWPDFLPTGKLLELLISHIENGKLENVSLSLILLAKREENFVVRDRILGKQLIPLLGKLFQEGSEEKIVTLLEAISCIMKQFAGDKSPIHKRAFQMFVEILSKSSSPEVQEASVKAILRITRISGNLKEIYNVVRNWNPQFQISKQLWLMIKTFVHRRQKNFFICKS